MIKQHLHRLEWALFDGFFVVVWFLRNTYMKCIHMQCSLHCLWWVNRVLDKQIGRMLASRTDKRSDSRRGGCWVRATTHTKVRKFYLSLYWRVILCLWIAIVVITQFYWERILDEWRTKLANRQTAVEVEFEEFPLKHRIHWNFDSNHDERTKIPIARSVHSFFELNRAENASPSTTTNAENGVKNSCSRNRSIANKSISKQ